MNRLASIALGVTIALQLAAVRAQDKPSNQPVKASEELVAAVNRGRVLRNQRNYDAAQTALEDVLAKTRAAKDRAGEALALNNIASVHRYRAGLTKITENQSPPVELMDKAAALYEQALIIANEIKDKPNEAYASLYLGVLSTARGEYDKAFTQYEVALKLYKEIDDPFYIAHTSMYMGSTALRKQQPELALKYYEAALPKYREIKYWLDAQYVVKEMDKAYQQLDPRARADR